MKHHAQKIPLGDWLATLLGLHPSRPAEKPAKRKSRPRHRHSAFFELP